MRFPATVASVLCATWLLSTTVAAAQASAARSADAQPSDEARAAAREAYGRAQQLFSAGDFAGAEAAFSAAYDAVPNPIVLMSVGECRERQGNIAGAIEAFERYLTERADAPDAEAVRARVAELRRRPATLVIRSAPPGAAIDLDSEATGEVTPAELTAPAGSHHVTLHLEGRGEAERDVEAAPGARVEVEATLEAEAAPPALGDGQPIDEPELEADAEESEAEEANTGVWITAGVSAGALLMGTVLGFLALSEESDFNDAPTADSADRGEKLALFADVAFGVAAAAALTGVVLHFTSGDDDEDEAEARIDVAPAVGPHGAGIAAQVTF